MAEGRRLGVVVENVLSNYAYVGLMAGVTLFLTPLYVRWLGAEQWGLVALCITVQAVLFLLDAGLAQVAPREFASAVEDRAAQWQLFVRFRALYGRIALAAFVVGQSAVGWMLADTQFASVAGAELALRLVLCQFALTFLNSAPMALWNGLQEQRRANVRQASFLAGKHALALGMVGGGWASAWAYVLPFVVVGAIEVGLNYRAVRRRYADVAAAKPVESVGSAGLLSRIGGFGVAVLAGMATTQIDRVLMASWLTVDVFGAYAVVVTFGLAFMNLQQPLQKAFLPRVVSAGAGSASTLFWLTAVLCALPCLLVAWQAHRVLVLWLGAELVHPDAARVLAWALVGVALNGLYAADYTRMVAANAWRVVLFINLTILVGQAALLAWAVPRWGMVAGGWSWALCGATQFCLGRWWALREGKGS